MIKAWIKRHPVWAILICAAAVLAPTAGRTPLSHAFLQNNLDFASFKGINAADPAGAQDLATKTYVDSHAGGGTPVFSPHVGKSANFSVAAGDNGKVFEVTTGSSAITVTLPSAATLGNGFVCTIRKVDAGIGSFIANSTLIGIQGQSLIIWSDGTNVYSNAFVAGLDSTGNLTFSAPGNITLAPGVGMIGFLKQAGFVDPVNPGKMVTVDVSGQTPGAGFRFIPSILGDSGSVASLSQSTGQFVVGFNLTTGGLLTDIIHWNDVQSTQDIIDAGSITSNAHTVPNSGNVDSVRLTASISAPLTVTWPDTANYTGGQRVRFYEVLGAINASNNVTVVGINGNTFNGNPSITLSDAFFDRDFIADPATGNWTVTTFGGSTGTGLNVGLFQPLTDAANIALVCDQSLNEQHHALVSTTGVGATRTITISNARNGEHGVIWFTHNSSGGDTVILQGQGTPSGGLGLFTLSSGANALDEIEWRIGASGKLLASAKLNYTFATIASCTTAGDVWGTGGTIGTALASLTGNKYLATKFIPTTGNANICRIDANIWKVGSPAAGTTLTAYIFTDSGGTGPSALVSGATSNGVDVAAVTATDATTAGSSPTTFTFPSTITVTVGTTYWVALSSSTTNSTNNFQWLQNTATGFGVYKDDNGVAPWNQVNANNKLRFTTYH